MSKAYDMIGQKFGRLTVVSRGPNSEGKSKATRWNCQCVCGKTVLCFGSNLKRGNSTSCGCFANEIATARIIDMRWDQTTHGMTYTSEYKSWSNMKSRCYNPNTINYHRYGGRGITVYEPWINDFLGFYNYICPKPKKKLTVDRIDNNKNYEPGNVRWGTKREQALNRETTIEFPGVAKSGNNRYRMSIDGYASAEEAHEAYLLAVANLENKRSRLS